MVSLLKYNNNRILHGSCLISPSNKSVLSRIVLQTRNYRAWGENLNQPPLTRRIQNTAPLARVSMNIIQLKWRILTAL